MKVTISLAQLLDICPSVKAKIGRLTRRITILTKGKKPAKRTLSFIFPYYDHLLPYFFLPYFFLSSTLSFSQPNPILRTQISDLLIANRAGKHGSNGGGAGAASGGGRWN